MAPLAAGGGGDQWSAFDAFVPEAAAAAPPERSPSRVPESALKVTTQQNSAMLRLHEQTIGQLATNSVTALVDTVQEVNSLPRVTSDQRLAPGAERPETLLSPPSHPAILPHPDIEKVSFDMLFNTVHTFPICHRT